MSCPAIISIQRGDRIRKPNSGGGSGGQKGSADGDGEDAFVFTLTRDEFLDLFFEDLELPNLAKRKLKTVKFDSPRPCRLCQRWCAAAAEHAGDDAAKFGAADRSAPAEVAGVRGIAEAAGQGRGRPGDEAEVKRLDEKILDDQAEDAIGRFPRHR